MNLYNHAHQFISVYASEVIILKYTILIAYISHGVNLFHSYYPIYILNVKQLSIPIDKSFELAFYFSNLLANHVSEEKQMNTEQWYKMTSCATKEPGDSPCRR